MASDLEKIEAYLANAPADKRAALETLRAQIRALAPDAVEYFSYGMPAFKMDKGLAGYAAAKHHCALYPMSSTIVPMLADELAAFRTSKGAIQFTVDKPLSELLVGKIINARMDEIATQTKSAAKPRERG